MEKRERLIKLVWHILPVLGLLIWGALAVTNYLWYDEAYSAALVSKNISDMIAITSKDVHSPFYYVLLKGFYWLCGSGENYWSLKVFSLIFSIGYMLIGKYWVKKLYGMEISIYFMLFSLMMPAMTVQTTNVRMYSIGLFFMTATGLCMLELYRGEESLKKWIIFALCSVCSVYCHTFQMIETLILYGFFFVVLIYHKQYKKLRGFFASGIIVAIAYLPWLRVTYLQMQTRIVQTAGDVASAATSEDQFNTLIIYAKEWFSAGETPYALVMYIGMAITLILGYFAVDYMREKKDYCVGFGLLTILLTALLGTFLNHYVAACFMGRYVFSVFGALALAYALGMHRMQNKWLKTGICIMALFCFVVQYRSELDLEYNTELDQYIEFIEENVKDGDCVIVEEYYRLMLSVYAPDLNYMAYGHLDEWMPFPVSEVFTEWEQLEKIEGTIWFLGDEPGLLGEKYTYEQSLDFHHMYYDLEVYRMIPRVD